MERADNNSWGKQNRRDRNIATPESNPDDWRVVVDKYLTSKAHESVTLDDNTEAEWTTGVASVISDSFPKNNLKMKVHEGEAFVFESVKEVGQAEIGSKEKKEESKIGPKMDMNHCGSEDGFIRGKGEVIGSVSLKDGCGPLVLIPNNEIKEVSKVVEPSKWRRIGKGFRDGELEQDFGEKLEKRISSV
ncbi:hypothetical protein QYF36_022248 [Acer negundo]|nr:hypothetical protein QYF36_022248 [Acer negundo]